MIRKITRLMKGRQKHPVCGPPVSSPNSDKPYPSINTYTELFFMILNEYFLTLSGQPKVSRYLTKDSIGKYRY